MGFFSDFKASLMRGDVLSLATAVVIGGAFGKIVGSAVDDVIMPIVGLITGGIDFTQKFISLNGRNVLQGYPGYLTDRDKYSPKKHYSELWNQRQVYL